jgi:hypothetical protein
MPDARRNNDEENLQTIDILRRLYGRRYTGLPVDSLDRDGFIINCAGAYMRPEMYDVQAGDTVRWRHNGRYVQGSVARIERTETLLKVELEHVNQLPPDYFPD